MSGPWHPNQPPQPPPSQWYPGAPLPMAHPRQGSSGSQGSQGSVGGGWSGGGLGGAGYCLPGTSQPPLDPPPATAPQLSTSQITEPLLAPKACAQCRSRKVKCNKVYPKCQQCVSRGETRCDYGQLVPVSQVAGTQEGDQVPQLEQRINDLERELGQLRASHSPQATVPSAFTESIKLAFLGTGGDSDRLAAFLQAEQARMAQSPTYSSGIGLGESSIGWRLTRPALARALSLHLITSFFSSCCAFLPAFEPWPGRAASLCAQLDQLGPAARVAVAGFCAMGARASPHSALLGMPLSPPEEANRTDKIMAAGVRRQQACQALQGRALDLCHQLGVDTDVSVENFEALLARTQMMIFNEVPPKKARACCLAALGHYRDLQDSADTPHHLKLELEQRLGLPLLLADAATSAGVRLPSLISTSEVVDYFSMHRLPEIETEQLALELDQIFPPYQGGSIHHDSLNQACNTLLRWLTSVNRAFAKLASGTRGSRSPILFPGTVKLIWLAVDQIHAAVRRLQHVVIEFAGVPVGCAADGCADLHCRMYTRLDRDADDITWLMHSLLQDRVGPWLGDEQEGRALLEESDRRVRRGIKLVAFYFTLYVSSRDPHQTYHLAFQLELIPSWTTIAVQKFGDNPGPDSAELELSPTELDWLENGLAVAAFYHPSAEQRLRELRRGRLDHEFQPLEMPGLVFPTAVESAMRRAATEHSGGHSHHAPSLPSQQAYDPSTWTPSDHSFGALGDFESADNEMWAEQMAESPSHPQPSGSGPARFQLPTTAATAHPPTYATAGGASSFGGGMPGNVYHTPQQQFRSQPGPQTGPQTLPGGWTYSPPHSTKTAERRTDQLHLPGGLATTAGMGGGDIRGMGSGPLSHGPGGRLQQPPGGAGLQGVPTSQGSQPHGPSAPHTNGFSNGRANGHGPLNGHGHGSGLNLPRPVAHIADPIPVRVTGGAGQGVQPGTRGAKATAGVVHVDQQYLGGWQGNALEQ